MNFKRTSLAAATALSVLAIGATAADALSLPAWLHRDATDKVAVAMPPTTKADAATAPAAAAVPALAPGQLLNYRAIVQT